MSLSSSNWFLISRMKLLLYIYLLVTLGFKSVENNSAQKYSNTVGILMENCDEDTMSIEEIVNATKLAPSIWTCQCHNYIEISNQVLLINQSGITHLIIVARRESLLFIESILGQLNIQLITLIPTNNELTADGKLQTPTSRKVCKDRAGGRQFWNLTVSILHDIINYFQWRNLYIYAEEIYGLAEVKQVYEAFRPYHKVASLKMIKTTGSMSIDDFLKQMSYVKGGVHEVKAVIVICGQNTTLELVQKAASKNLFSVYYRWLIFNGGWPKVLNNIKLQFDTDVIMFQHKTRKTINSVVVSALKSRNKINITSLERDEICTNTYNNTEIHSNISTAQHHSHLPQNIELEFFRVRRTMSNIPSIRSIGTWTPKTGFKNINPDLIPDLDAVTLQVAALHCPPYVFVIKGKGGNMTFVGYLVDVIEAMAKMANFRFNITLPYDHTYGTCDEDGLCTGIIGFLVRKEVDLALANLTPTGPRVELMDFSTTPVDKGGLSILYRRPSKTDENIISAYFMPFSLEVSLCVLTCIPLIGINLYLVLYVVNKAGGELYENNVESRDNLKSKHDRSIGRCLFIALQSFGQQGIDIIPITTSGRVVFGIMWLFSLFIMSAYTANLISYFTATFVTVPFKSFEEMYLSKKYKIGFMKGTTYMDDIQGDNKTLLMQLWKQLQKQKFSTLVEDLEEGLERVRNEKYIFMHEARVLEHIASKDCEFATMNERYLSAPMMLAFQKNSQFKRPISDMLLKMSESGLLEKLKNRWWPPIMDCTLASQTFQSISLWGMTSIFGLLASGLFLGFCIMIIERFIKAQKLSQRLKRLNEVFPDNLRELSNFHLPIKQQA